jgi:glutamyl-tRNA reductase
LEIYQLNTKQCLLMVFVAQPDINHMEILQSHDKQNRSVESHRLILHHQMNLHVNHRIDRFCIAGISYKKADYSVRGRFSLDEAAKEAILFEAAGMGLQSVLMVSTCNRTEIYGYANHPHVLGALLVKHAVGGTMDELLEYGYFHQGFDALKHAFRVGSGLDSQIIGDFEIAGQMKHALNFSQQRKMVGPILDRTFNFITQASKKIKNQTALSTGTVSVSFAAIEWLQEKLQNQPAKVLVVGAGKFGANVIKNLLHYLPAVQVTICNRTPDKAIEMANSLSLGLLPMESLQVSAKNFDVIITCTNAQMPLIYADYLEENKKYLLIDLSVPANIDESVEGLPFTELVNVDDISIMLDKTICRRMADVPKAEAIIEEHIAAFYEWLITYRHAPMVNEMRRKLVLYAENVISNHHEEMSVRQVGANGGGYDENIRTTVNNLMVNLKTRREKGCQMIAAYHDFFSMQNNVGLP